MRVLMTLACVAMPALLSAEQAPPASLHFLRTREIPLRVRTTERETSPVQYTLWVTEDEGVSWRPARETEVRRTDSEFRFQASSDGRYGFLMVGRDAAHNEGPSPTNGTVPEILVVVDTVPPVVTVQEPKDRQPIRAGSPVTVRWEVGDANPGAGPVSILVSYGGRNAAPAASALPAKGSFVLHPPLDETSMLIQVVAVDLARNRSEAAPVPVTLSTSAEVQVTAGLPDIETPPEARRGVNIWYRVEGIGPSGLREVDLWYTLDNGNTWEFYGRDEDLVPPFFFVPAKPGRYGFHLDAVKMTESAGGAPPKPGTKPMLSHVYDPIPPSVSLVGPRGGEFLKGGDTVEIRWNAEDDLFGERPITLWYTTRPPQWQKAAGADALPNTGRFGWVVPRVDTTTLHLRVTAVDQAGNVSESDPSGAITVDAQGDARVVAHGVQTFLATPGRTDDGRSAHALGAMESARMSYERALYYMEIERHFAKAQEGFEEALRLYPGYVAALNDLGVLYFREGVYGKAVDMLVRTRAANGENPRVLINLALCYHRLGRPDDALAQMQTLSLMPALTPGQAADAGTVLLDLARDFLRRGNRSQARVAALTAAGLPNAPRDLVNTARSLAP